MPITTVYPNCACCGSGSGGSSGSSSGSGGGVSTVLIPCLPSCNLIPTTLTLTIGPVANCACISGKTFTLTYSNPLDTFCSGGGNCWSAITATCGGSEGVVIRLIPCIDGSGCTPADCPSIPSFDYVWVLFFYQGPYGAGIPAFYGSLNQSLCNYSPFTMTFTGLETEFGSSANCCPTTSNQPSVVMTVMQ